MKRIVLNIFARIWFIWFLITFFAIVIVCYPFIFFSTKKYTRKNVLYISGIYHFCARFFCILCAFRIRIVGYENYDKNQKYIIVSNHRSLLDIPMLTGIFHARIIAKDSFFTKVPVFSIYYKRGAVLVDRTSRNSRSESFSKMKAVLDHNVSMAIYPEGTRNRTNQSILNFHNGAFKLAKLTSVHILPVVLINTDKAISTTKHFFAMPTKIKIHILPAINPDDFATMEELRDTIRERIKEIYEQNSKS